MRLMKIFVLCTCSIHSHLLYFFFLSLSAPPSFSPPTLLQAYLYSHTKTGLFVEAVVSARGWYRGAEDQSFKWPCYPSTIWPPLKLRKDLRVMNELQKNLVGFNWNKQHTSSLFWLTIQTNELFTWRRLLFALLWSCFHFSHLFMLKGIGHTKMTKNVSLPWNKEGEILSNVLVALFHAIAINGELSSSKKTP